MAGNEDIISLVVAFLCMHKYCKMLNLTGCINTSVLFIPSPPVYLFLLLYLFLLFYLFIILHLIYSFVNRFMKSGNTNGKRRLPPIQSPLTKGPLLLVSSRFPVLLSSLQSGQSWHLPVFQYPFPPCRKPLPSPVRLPSASKPFPKNR